jgi:hypothetical protein
MTRILLAALVAIAMVLSCCDRTELVSGRGTVVFLSIEGGFYGIIDDNDDHWDPSNLPQQYRVDSLRVQFEGVITDACTPHMWGRTVELRSIRRLD